MFNTTLTNEFIQLHEQFGWDENLLEKLSLNAVNASLLPAEQKHELRVTVQTEFQRLGAEYLA
jgi:adenosine deaminase